MNVLTLLTHLQPQQMTEPNQPFVYIVLDPDRIGGPIIQGVYTTLEGATYGARVLGSNPEVIPEEGDEIRIITARCIDTITSKHELILHLKDNNEATEPAPVLNIDLEEETN